MNERTCDKQTLNCNQRANDYLMCAYDVLGYQFHFTTKISWNFLTCMLFGWLVGLWRWHRAISIEIICIMARSKYTFWMAVLIVIVSVLLARSLSNSDQMEFGRIWNSPRFITNCKCYKRKCDKGGFSWINTASKGTNVQNANQCKCNVCGFQVSRRRRWANRKRCQRNAYNLSP